MRKVYDSACVKKKKKKKRSQKAPSQFSAVSIFMFHSFLASSSAISWQKRLLFLLSVEQPFALHSFVAGHFLFLINNSSQELSSHPIYIGFVQKKTHCSRAVQQLHGLQ